MEKKNKVTVTKNLYDCSCFISKLGFCKWREVVYKKGHEYDFQKIVKHIGDIKKAEKVVEDKIIWQRKYKLKSVEDGNS